MTGLYSFSTGFSTVMECYTDPYDTYINRGYMFDQRLSQGEVVYLKVLADNNIECTDVLKITGPSILIGSAKELSTANTEYTITIPAGGYVWVKSTYNTSINWNGYFYIRSNVSVTAQSYYSDGYGGYRTGNSNSGTDFTLYGHSSSRYEYMVRLYSAVETTVTIYIYR